MFTPKPLGKGLALSLSQLPILFYHQHPLMKRVIENPPFILAQMTVKPENGMLSLLVSRSKLSWLIVLATVHTSYDNYNSL